MLTYPAPDPILFELAEVPVLGELAVRWYGLMYLVGFVGGWWLGRVRAKRTNSGWTAEQIDDLMFYVAIGVVAGGRIGYILFYDFAAWIEDPLRLLMITKGGMAFHGGLIGVIIAMWLFGRKYGKTLFSVADFVAPLVPIGLFAGRIGNFINGELWGAPASDSVPWAMQVKCADFQHLCFTKLNLPPGTEWSPALHPSQLYQAALEGVALFTILWLFSAKPRPTLAVSGLFLICYGLFRFAMEFIRMPDAHLGYIAFGWLTMGQLLSVPMVLIGLGMLAWGYQFAKTRPA